jgi:signal transduction histidine kinase
MHIDTCFISTEAYHSIAYYSHLIPVAVLVFLVVFLRAKSGLTLAAKLFSYFIATLCLWFIGDVILWTQSGYEMIAAVWAPLDHINIVFSIFALYFYLVFASNRDLTFSSKVVLFSLTLPALWLTVSGQSILYFYQPWCEAINNDFLTYYKLTVEGVTMLGIILATFVWWPKNNPEKKKQLITISSALILFLSVFSITEYISSQTGIYEINLYSFFVLPVFIFMVVYAITDLEIFEAHLIGTQLLAYSLVILVAAQFFFLEDPTDRLLTSATFLLTLGFAILLVRSSKREAAARAEIHKLNEGQERFIHFLSHEIKGFITVARNGYASIIDGDFGPAPEPLTVFSKKAFDRLNTGVIVVESILKSANLKSGKVEFKFAPFDICSAIRKRIELAQPLLKERNLTLDAQLPDGDYIIVGDAEHLTDHVLRNLIENAIFYTPAGTIRVMLSRKANSVVFSVKDTGVGITPEDKKRLFTEGGQGANAMLVNAHSTGHGLFIAKNIVDAHNGRIWAESEGEGKGTTFYVELPINPPQGK